VRGIKSGKRLLQLCARGQELAEMEAGKPGEPVAHHRHCRVCAVLALQHLVVDLILTERCLVLFEPEAP
jgi:hypothetical protein